MPADPAIEHAVARVRSESAAVEEAMPRLIRIICEMLWWNCGDHWDGNRAAKLLR
ncbi:MAG: hypothetical protein IT529_02605 [Burkholderiales bacterium]|nr:hypothetical protein [Burkholderiales bacterium]